MTNAVVTVAGLLGRVAAAVGAGDRDPSALAAESAVVGRLEGGARSSWSTRRTT